MVVAVVILSGGGKIRSAALVKVAVFIILVVQ